MTCSQFRLHTPLPASTLEKVLVENPFLRPSHSVKEISLREGKFPSVDLIAFTSGQSVSLPEIKSFMSRLCVVNRVSSHSGDISLVLCPDCAVSETHRMQVIVQWRYQCLSRRDGKEV